MMQILQKLLAFITVPLILIVSIFYLKYTAKKEATRDIEQKELGVIKELKIDDQKRRAGGVDAASKRLHKDAID
jgi:hypothetical protein